MRYNGNVTYKGSYSINPSSCNYIDISFKVLYFYYIFSFFSWIYAKLYENMYFLFKISLRQKIMPILTYLSQSSILLRNAQRIGGYEERSVVAYFTKERLQLVLFMELLGHNDHLRQETDHLNDRLN